MFASKAVTRKADLVAHLARQLRGHGLSQLWKRLNDLARKAVSEAVHNPSGPLDTAEFEAKYGAFPTGTFRGRYATAIANYLQNPSVCPSSAKDGFPTTFRRR